MAVLERAELPPGPSYVEGGLEMPPLDVPWSPPRLAVSDPSTLADALAEYDAVNVALDPRLRGTTGEQLREGLAAMAPRVRIEPGKALASAAALDSVPLPLETVEEDRETGPVWDSSSVRAKIGYVDALRDAQTPAGLWIGTAPIDVERWRRRPPRSEGSCSPLMETLGVGQERALAKLEPFLDHADLVLDRLYRRAMAEALPRVRADLEQWAPLPDRKAFASESEFAVAECGHAAWEYARTYGGCVDEDGECRTAPRVFVVGAARIGSAEPSVYVPDSCPQVLGRDYVEALREPAREAVETAADVLDPRWAGLADRLGALGELHAALDDVCTPRRRRFSEGDVDMLRERVVALGDRFNARVVPRHDARWLMFDEEFHVGGFGVVHQLARFDSGSGSAPREILAGARGLRELGLTRARCQAEGSDVPLATILVDAEDGSVDYLGYFYPEQLTCSDLGPAG